MLWTAITKQSRYMEIRQVREVSIQLRCSCEGHYPGARHCIIIIN